MITRVGAPHKVSPGDVGGSYGLTITTFGLIKHAAHISTSLPPPPPLRLHRFFPPPPPPPKTYQEEESERRGG